MRTLLRVLPLLILAGCIGETPARFSVAPLSVSDTERTNAKTISIVQVNLPSYAKEPGIFIQDTEGSIVPIPKADWADDTERAMRLSLVRNLAEITGAEVASDPWPLGGVPEAEIRVDVEQMLVDSSLTMRLSGQFSIRRDVATNRSRIRQFNLTTPARSGAPSDVVAAHGESWQELARTIAKAL